jgi:hypothetical protein
MSERRHSWLATLCTRFSPLMDYLPQLKLVNKSHIFSINVTQTGSVGVLMQML